MPPFFIVLQKTIVSHHSSKNLTISYCLLSDLRIIQMRQLIEQIKMCSHKLCAIVKVMNAATIFKSNLFCN